jgi:4-hydroxy-4-methyl-2-oxoglutarate aldolase
MVTGFRVYTDIERPNSDLLALFDTFQTPDISDAMNRAGTMDNGIQAINSPPKRVIGPAVTVSVPTGAFNVIKAGMQQTRRGDVLVINARGSLRGALIGGNVCRGLFHRGLAGVVMDGAIRDTAEVQRDGLPVYARGLSAMMGPIEGPGEVNVPIACGHVVVHPGDIIVADADGIVVVRPDEAERIAAETRKLLDHYAGPSVRDVLLRGEVTNIANIERGLREQGCEFISARTRRPL